MLVDGNQLVDLGGDPIRMAGVNRSGGEYACSQGFDVMDGPIADADLDLIATWKANLIRLPFNESCWLGVERFGDALDPELTGESYRSFLVDLVDRLNARGMVVIIDLHWVEPGDVVAQDGRVMANVTNSLDTWESVATTFRDNPAVIFDVYNEPHDITWDCWRDGCTTDEGWEAAGMQQLVDVVRSTGATQPIIVSGLAFANDLSGWLEYRPTDPANALIAGFHVYDFNLCMDPSCWSETLDPILEEFPIIISEVGEASCDGLFVSEVLDWADARELSYTAWTWNPWGCADGEPSLIEDFEGTPSTTGLEIQARIEAAVS